ncbi:hypothetical protein CLOM_g22281 [Closterium sp. NIES-68]|nr:hypothetical protein CLOM_g22281 [Closterium sp. NIES-68]
MDGWMHGARLMMDSPADPVSLLTGLTGNSFSSRTNGPADDKSVLGNFSADGGTSYANLGSVADFEEEAYEGLAAAYAFVGVVALVQLVRIQLRVPEYGWTTQKVFHLLNFFLCAARCAVFLSWEQVQSIKDYVPRVAILDVPSLFFFTTYTLLILFWAEIYHQARGVPSEDLRRTFCFLNVAIYILQGGVWIYMHFVPEHMDALIYLTKLFRAGVAFTGAFGFMLYGGRLFVMLNTFPVESRGRRNKLMEVGLVTAIGFTSFTIRAFMVAFSAMSEHVPLDKLEAPVFNVVYYMLF